MAGSTFRLYRQTLVPTTHQRAQGAAFQGQLGDVEDSLVDRSKQAVKARMPLLSPSDGIAALGVERQILRGPTETDAVYAARLQAAWSTWPWAGTAFGVLSALYALGYLNLFLVTQNGFQYRISADGTTLIGTANPGGAWFIDSNDAPAGTTPWAANTVYAANATVIPSAVTWAPGTTYAAGAVVKPTSTRLSGFYYRSAGGLSGSTEPTWPSSPAGTVVDGSVTWTAFRKDLWFRTAAGGTSGPTQPTWPPTFAGALWGGFTWGSGYGLTVADNTVQWACDGNDFWSRFDLVFTGPLASGQVSGSSDEANLIRSIVKAWRPGYVTNNRITIVGYGGTWGGLSTPTWGAFRWATASPLWNGFNWGSGAHFASGPYWAKTTQYGTAGLKWGSASTTNWSGG